MFSRASGSYYLELKTIHIAKLYLLERPVLNPYREKDVQMASSYRRPLFYTNHCRGRKLLLFTLFSLV